MDYQKIQDSQIAAEKLQAQKNVAALYAEVKHYFESAKTEDIVSSLEHIKKSIEEDSKYSLTTDEYTLLGFITYLIGLDVTNSREHVKVVPADNLRSRFIDNSLNAEKIITPLIDILKVIDVVNFDKAKTELKEILETPVTGSKQELGEMRIAIKQSLKHYAIPVIIAKDLSELVSKENLTYKDVLRYNTIIHRDSMFLDGSMKSTLRLLTNITFVKAIQKGESLYLQQKFSLIHFDSIISAHELVNSFPNILEYTLVPFETKLEASELLDKYGISDAVAEPQETKTETEATEAKPEEPKRLPEEEPDFFVRACAEEYLKRKIETVDDFFEAVEAIIKSDKEFLGYFYQYIGYQKTNKENRKPFEEVWTEFSKEELHQAILTKISEYQSQGKEIAEHIYAEIPDKNRGHIANYVHECIDNLVILTDEKANTKSYLISQFSENGITTYHHLQQIMMLIESQYICGTGFTSYCQLYDYIVAQTDAKELFEETNAIDGINTNIRVYTQLKSFLFGDEKVEQKEATTSETTGSDTETSISESTDAETDK